MPMTTSVTSRVYAKNALCQEPRKAYRLDDTKQFKEELIKRLKSGKNCVAFCGTKTIADEVNKQVKKELPDLAILYYSRDTPGSVKEADLADVKCRWLQCSLLLYTSMLTVGVSADIDELCWCWHCFASHHSFAVVA